MQENDCRWLDRYFGTVCRNQKTHSNVMRMDEANRRMSWLESELEYANKSLDTTANQLRQSREREHNLRCALGEPVITNTNIKYRRACLALNLDERDYRPIPPIHIHVTPKGYDYGLCGHTQAYLIDLYIPEGEALDPRTACVVHDSLHELVDFVEMKTRGRCSSPAPFRPI